MARPVVVDIHTHMYPPEYMAMLSSRSTIPLVRTFPSSPDPRLILLDAELPALERALAVPAAAADPAAAPLPGRPLTPHFTSLPHKLAFMAAHGITMSVLSLANPWLDFLPPDEAVPAAAAINAAFEGMCAAPPARGKLYFFAALPLTAPVPSILAAVAHARTLRHCRGVILSTAGLDGSGLDDPALRPVWAALADGGLPVFLHPHYGLPADVYGPSERALRYGHVLPLAVGFPVETTLAVARMYLAGVFDETPGLRVILAHAGGTLPFLAGRIESCVAHDGLLARREAAGDERRRSLWEVLREQVYLDAVVYSEVGLRAAVEASGGGREGAGRLMFGTDHPFFPPVTKDGRGDEEGEWESVRLNVEAVNRALGEGSEEAAMVMGGNAVRVLRLYEDEQGGSEPEE